MAEPKTRPTEASLEDYLASRATPAQLEDCRTLVTLLGRVTGHPPCMWGPSIVGFGSYAYRYASGHSGTSCLTGFAIRGRELVVYLAPGAPEAQGALARLGPHRMGKGCLYLKRLAEVDLGALETLVASSVAELRRRYPDPGTP